VDLVGEEESSRSVPATRSAISQYAAGPQPGPGWKSMPQWRKEGRIVSSFHSGDLDSPSLGLRPEQECPAGFFVAFDPQHYPGPLLRETA